MSAFKALLQLGRLGLRHPAQLSLIWQIRRRRLSYLGLAALAELSQAVWQVEQDQVPGSLIEAGCALGGSAIAITAAKRPARPLAVFDTFERIPPPSEKDGDDVHRRYRDIQTGAAPGIRGDTYYGYQSNLLERVRENFQALGFDLGRWQVSLVPGLFEDTLHPGGPVALAHLDCDWYDSVKTCLERIVPRLSAGGILVIDDYRDWSGCRQAVDEYFANQGERFSFTMRARLHIRRLC